MPTSPVRRAGSRSSTPTTGTRRRAATSIRDDGEASISRTKTAHDAATPAGNGTMVGVLARLHYLHRRGGYRDRAEALVKAFSGELEQNFSPLSTLANNSEILRRAVQVVVCGERAEEGDECPRRRCLRNQPAQPCAERARAGEALPLGIPPRQGQHEGSPRPTSAWARSARCR
ncbi:hypothetical protein GBAR_LOCUS17585 [Geodia barretti]|uniref:Uncharacterized protein n=1 Tax=Geodia barretti TaxID=519541 RepID=A0AA35SJ23_GEOBA|nr:hypothetical protein GBAR_LOCUS17585 [Geodia barretti]